MKTPFESLCQYDPALAETYEQGGDDELAIIARLSGDVRLGEGTRIVSRFGDIVTLRVHPDKLTALAEDEALLHMEAPRKLRRAINKEVTQQEDGQETDPFIEDWDEDIAAEETTNSLYSRRPPGVSATGKGCVVGVLDWGCDFAFPSFRHPDGTSRILALWDQRPDAMQGRSNRWGYGRVYLTEEINQALASEDPYKTLGYDPADADDDRGAHGTHVLDIAAGNGRGGGIPGVAPEADIVFVHLSRTTKVLGKGNLGDSATVLEALDFVFSVAGERPCVVNMSVGAHGGPHDGTTGGEQGIDRVVSLSPGRAVVNSAGNYFSGAVHAQGRMNNQEDQVLRFKVPGGDPTVSELEVWYPGSDKATATVIGPDGNVLATVEPGQHAPLLHEGDDLGHIYQNSRHSTNGDNQIDLFLKPHAPAGIWQLHLHGDDIVDGQYHAWIERDTGLRPRFLSESAVNSSTTGTLCNGKLSITVGAYNPHDDRKALGRFSSSGPTRDGRIKPEIVAPGVRIQAARSTPPGKAPGARYRSKSGTSMAAPHVTGTIALMFEAAGAPLEISETRALLFASAERDFPTLGAQARRDMHRYGYGYLDITAAERAARNWANIGRNDQIHEVMTMPESTDDFMEGLDAQELSFEGPECDRVPIPLQETLEQVLLAPGQSMDSNQFHQLALSSIDAQANDQLVAIARPTQIPGEQIQVGDLLVRSIPGDRVLHSAIILSGRPESASELSFKGTTLESFKPGSYIEVIEVPYGGGQVRKIGRRLTDANGRMLRGQSVFRVYSRSNQEPLMKESVSEPEMQQEVLAEDLNTLRDRLTQAVQAGGAALASVAQLGRQSLEGAQRVLREVVVRHKADALTSLITGGASMLQRRFAEVLEGGTSLMIGLLLADDNIDQMRSLARTLLDRAAVANRQSTPFQTPWTRAFPHTRISVAPGTGVLGSIITVILSRFTPSRFFPDLGRDGLFRDFIRGLRTLGRRLNPMRVHLGFNLSVPFARVQRLLVEFVRYAKSNRQAEETLLRLVDDHPFLSPFILSAVAIEALVSGNLPWIKYIGKDLNNPAHRRQLDIKVQTLPAPGTRRRYARGNYQVKYLIVSDIHRDKEDDRYASGPINHFSKNKGLYERVLDYALGSDEDSSRYILIENGDAEEFWAVPNIAQSPADRMRDLLRRNERIYRKLKQLHSQGRYYRTQGNHDGPLREASAFNVLQQWDGGWPGPDPFRVWDFIIIPGVKTMDEYTLLDLMLDPRVHPADYIGLDPDRYTNKKSLIVCHGHQFDFWNCEENELFGRIVTAMIRYPDGWMDQVLPLQGIHMQGNPLYDFGDFFAHDRNLLFNHWPEKQASIVKAHHVQHLANRERQLQDSWMYQETIASVLVSLLMPLSHGATGGASQSLQSRLGHQLLIGHTHYPQSQPFYPVGRVLTGLPGYSPAAANTVFQRLGALIGASLGPGGLMFDRLSQISGSDLLERWLDSTFKSRFFNSGVSGWHKGVMYAIEITTQGQARLLYWTDRHAAPQEMDWELAPLTPRQKRQSDQMRERYRRLFGTSLQRMRQELNQALDNLARPMGVSSAAGFRNLLGIFGRGTQSMIDTVASPATQQFRSILGQQAAARLQDNAAPHRLQLGLIEFLTRIGQQIMPRHTGGESLHSSAALETDPAGTNLPTFRIEISLSPPQLQQLESVKQQLESAGLVPDATHRNTGAYHMAIVWMFANEYAPLVGNAHEGRASCRPDLQGYSLGGRTALKPHDNVIRTVGSMLAWMPIHKPLGLDSRGRPVALVTHVNRNGSNLQIEMSLTAAQATTMQPSV